MSELWYLLIIIAAAATIVLVLRARRSSEQTRRENLAENDSGSRDYAQEREASRVSNMSESDQAWQAASLQRHRENKAREQSAAEKP